MEMLDRKSKGPGGFTTNLFHACRSIVKEDVWKVVEDSIKSSGVLHALIYTFFTCIPKKDSTLDSRKFWPISLCNVVYKIITKVIDNKLKPLMPMIISLEQTSYVKGH